MEDNKLTKAEKVEFCIYGILWIIALVLCLVGFYYIHTPLDYCANEFCFNLVGK